MLLMSNQAINMGHGLTTGPLAFVTEVLRPDQPKIVFSNFSCPLKVIFSNFGCALKYGTKPKHEPCQKNVFRNRVPGGTATI